MAQEREMEMNKDDELLERLEGYNPPDRTIPSWRPIAVDIAEAAARIRELKAENARLIQDANESNRILGDMCEQQSKRAECAEADLAAAVAALVGVVRVADRATDEFDAARAVVAAHMKEKP